jgi:parvulin-like peptidyl-prolyl isomerase
MKNPWSAPLLLTALLATGCASTSYLAKVNDDKITGTDLKDEFQRKHGGHQKFLLGESETRQFLNVVIDEKLLMQESYRLDLESIPAIRKSIEEYASNRAADHLLKVEIEDKANPTPEQVKEVWETETTLFYQGRQIVSDTKREADEVYMKLLFGGDFEQLARACSIVPSWIQGGRLSWAGWGSMEPSWEKVVHSLAPGETSEVFEGQKGWEIFQLEQIEGAERPDFAQASKRIEGILKSRMLKQRKQELSDYLWTKYHAKQVLPHLGLRELADAMNKNPDGPIATWDGGSLSVKQFVSGLERKDFEGLPPGRAEGELEKQLRQTVNEPLTVLEARARGYEKIPSVEEATRVRQEDLMENALYADYITKDVAVSDSEIQAYYDAHKADFMTPEKRRVSQIVVPTKEDAEAIRKAIADGQAFESLVSRSTDADSAKKKGDLGWITAKDAKGEFDAVFTLAGDQVSAPIPSKFGFHLIKVTEIVPPKPMSFDQARPQIREKLIDQKKREQRKVWIQKLRQAATIEINNAGITAFVKANSPS